MQEVKYGLRNKLGKYARVTHVFSESNEDDEGSDFYFLEDPTSYSELPIFETDNVANLILVLDGISEWASSADRPAAKPYRASPEEFYPVQFAMTHTYDIPGGEPVATTRHVRRIALPKFIAGPERHDEKLKSLLPHTAFADAYADIGDDAESVGHIDVRYVKTEDEPEPLMFIGDVYNEPCQVIAVEKLTTDGVYALLVTNNPRHFKHLGVVPMIDELEEEPSAPSPR